MKLIAQTNILYLNRMYEAGEELPTSDKVMVDAWLEAGTAKDVDGVVDDCPISSDEQPEEIKPAKRGKKK